MLAVRHTIFNWHHFYDRTFETFNPLLANKSKTRIHKNKEKKNSSSFESIKLSNSWFHREHNYLIENRQSWIAYFLRFLFICFFNLEIFLVSLDSWCPLAHFCILICATVIYWYMNLTHDTADFVVIVDAIQNFSFFDPLHVVRAAQMLLNETLNTVCTVQKLFIWDSCRHVTHFLFINNRNNQLK